MELIGLKRCSTCKAVEKTLKTKGLQYSYREIDLNPPTAEELSNWYQQTGYQNMKKIVNTSGMKYRELGLKDTWDQLTEQQQFELLATDGMLVKRPILLVDNGVYWGADVALHLETL